MKFRDSCCSARALFLCLACFVSLAAPPCLLSDDWPQWLGPKRDGVWRETGILKKFPEAGPLVRWRTPIGSGYSGPAVAASRVFVHDRKLASGVTNPANAFDRGRILGTERVLCLDEKDGSMLWTHEYESPYTISYASGPRATPVVHQGKVYTLGAEGQLYCLSAANGQPVWSRDFVKDFDCRAPVWGFAGHPLIDGNKLICLVGGQGSVAVAFDKDDGTVLWKSLSAREPAYAPPVIYEFDGQRQLIIWHPEAVNGLDPETGRLLWTHRWPIRCGMSISTPRKIGDRLYLTSFYSGSLMLRIDGTNLPLALWNSPKASEMETEMLHSVMSTPVVLSDYIYGTCSYGQLRCLKTTSGERVWETFAPITGRSERWGNAFIVSHDGRYFLFNEKGQLIIARLSPSGYEELDRATLIQPNNNDPRRPVVWSHPAFANRSVYTRNDTEIVCVSLADD